MEEGDPGSDSDFEIDAKKDVSDRFQSQQPPPPVWAPSLTPHPVCLCPPPPAGGQAEPHQHRRL